MEELEQCKNCGHAIGKLETPFIWKDNIVCSHCYERLIPKSPKNALIKKKTAITLAAILIVLIAVLLYFKKSTHVLDSKLQQNDIHSLTTTDQPMPTTQQKTEIDTRFEAIPKSISNIKETINRKMILCSLNAQAFGLASRLFDMEKERKIPIDDDTKKGIESTRPKSRQELISKLDSLVKSNHAQTTSSQHSDDDWTIFQKAFYNEIKTLVSLTEYNGGFTDLNFIEFASDNGDRVIVFSKYQSWSNYNTLKLDHKDRACDALRATFFPASQAYVDFANAVKAKKIVFVVGYACKNFLDSDNIDGEAVSINTHTETLKDFAEQRITDEDLLNKSDEYVCTNNTLMKIKLSAK